MATDVSAPPRNPTPPALGGVGTLRYLWRLLTSMRTALVLLFLLAVAAVPGSVFPQRGVAPLRVRDYFVAHPALAPWLDRVGAFDVYASPWFAAVYLLLMVSLAGCVVPRALHHVSTLRAGPPATPRNLARMPEHQRRQVDAPPDQVIDRAANSLRSNRYRVLVAADGSSVSAEKGYLRELGNLVFHLALLLLLVGVAVGSLYGTKGTVVVVEGDGFSNTPTQYDDLTLGRAVSAADLPPFSFTLDSFDATFVSSGPRTGQPDSFRAAVTYRAHPGDAEQQADIRVNYPLMVDGSKVYLLSWGYAPQFTVRDGNGDKVFSGAVPFLPQDPNFASTGVVKVPDARPDQLGFQGLFLPTAVIDRERGPISLSPLPNDPVVFLGAFTGDLGLDTGQPQSVYLMDTSSLTRIGRKALRPGQTWHLPGDRGTITFDGYRHFANFQVAQDPGRQLALAGAVLALLGLVTSLVVRRRRVWVRATTGGDGRTLVEVAALARTESSDLVADLAPVIAAVEQAGGKEHA
jgi:cytochrome c biogenesis protein